MNRIQNIKFLLIHAWQSSKSFCLSTAVTYAFLAVTPFINIVGLGMVVNALVTGETRKQILILIIIYLALTLAVTVIWELLYMANSYLQRVITNINQFDFSKDSVNVDYHYAQDGTILNLRRKGMGALPGFSIYKIGLFINHIIQFAGIISILSLLSPWFILVLAVTSTVSVILTFRTQKNDFDFQNDKVEEDRKIDYLYKVMTEYNYAKEIRINNAENYVADKYAGTLQTQVNKLKSLYRKSIKINMASTIITVVQTAAMYLFFSYQVYRGQINIAEYTVLLGTATLLVGLLLEFFDNIAQINNSCKSIDFYRQYKALVENCSIVTASNKLEAQSVDFFNAAIKFEDVSFTYPNIENQILNNINIKISNGEKLVVVGMNGAGKSTFIKLMCKFYRPTSGKIMLNGIDIWDIPNEKYYKIISAVFQDFTNLSFTIKESVSMSENGDLEKIDEIISGIGLKERIAELPNNYETYLTKSFDSDGIELSGGQTQKIAIARAVYKDTPVLILDEPTANLDPKAESEIYADFFNIAKDKTTIFISHRLAVSTIADNIAVFSHGRITEYGSHDALIKQGGIYAEMFSRQGNWYVN